MTLAKRLRSVGVAAIRRLDDLYYRDRAPQRVLFRVKNGFGFAVQYPVLRLLAQDPRFFVRVTAKQALLKCATEQQQAAFERWFLPLSKASRLKWHQTLATDRDGMWFSRNSIHMIMSHGSAYGNSDYTLRMAGGRSHVYLSASQAEADFVDRHLCGRDQRLTLVAGFPKSDQLVQGGYDREGLLSRLGLDPRRKTIVIGSHWSECGILPTLQAAPLAKLAECLPEVNVIQTGHPNLYDRTSLMVGASVQTNGFVNARVMQSAGAEELLNAADLLVTDHSSLMTTYSLLDRPIVFFANPQYAFFDSHVESLYREASTAFRSVEELPDICRQELTSPSSRSAGRRRIADHFGAYQGRAAQRVKDILHEIGLQCTTASDTWRDYVTKVNGAVPVAARADTPDIPSR